MVKMISRNELQKWIDSGKEFKLVDVLDGAHFAKEHIKGALNLPLDEKLKRAQTILKDKGETIVVYCASFECQASTMAAKKLIAMGYKDVYDYKGGG
jgi:rhodanese-related sulfurtransferase